MDENEAWDIMDDDANNAGEEELDPYMKKLFEEVNE